MLFYTNGNRRRLNYGFISKAFASSVTLDRQFSTKHSLDENKTIGPSSIFEFESTYRCFNPPNYRFETMNTLFMIIGIIMSSLFNPSNYRYKTMDILFFMIIGIIISNLSNPSNYRFKTMNTFFMIMAALLY